MPISREEFERGAIDLSLPIAQILSSRPDLAFSIEELQTLLNESSARDASLDEIGLALDSLITQNIVEAKELEGQQWYTLREQEGRRLGFL